MRFAVREMVLRSVGGDCACVTEAQMGVTSSRREAQRSAMSRFDIRRPRCVSVSGGLRHAHGLGRSVCLSPLSQSVRRKTASERRCHPPTHGATDGATRPDTDRRGLAGGGGGVGEGAPFYLPNTFIHTLITYTDGRTGGGVGEYFPPKL
jgi:hypothetical protein